MRNDRRRGPGGAGHDATADDAQDARLRATLAAAGFDEERAATAIALVRAELVRDEETREAAAGRASATASMARFRTLADVAPQLVWRSRGSGHWIWASPNWLSYTGQSQGESHGLGWLDAVHPDDHEATMRAWDEARRHGSFDIEHRVRRALDGAWRLHATRAAPLRSRVGDAAPGERTPEWIGTSADVEDFRRLEVQQHALLLELRHRTRNLLAVVQVIARKSLPAIPGRDDFAARLASLGRVQGFLTRGSAWSVPLRDLIEAELRATGDGEAERAEVTGPSVELPGQMVQPVALALHELAANAAKHGALAQPSGHLAVTWRLEADDGATRLVIEWRESGVVMPPGPLPRRFGREMIERTVPYQLRGEARLERGEDGVHCHLAVPLPEEQSA